MKRLSPPDWPASWLRMRSPLSVKLRVSRRVIVLAGGAEAINERFADRLRGFFARGVAGFEVWFTDTVAGALSNRQPSALFMLSTYVERHWAAEDHAIEYTLEGFELDRGIFPVTGRDLLSVDDPFWLLFSALRDLVVNWPEIVDAVGATDLPRQCPPPR